MEAKMSGNAGSFHLDMEQELYFLRVHFEMCEGSNDSEMADWGRFYLEWSRKASRECGAWSKGNLETAEKIFQTLQRSKTGLMGFEVLKKAMAEASYQLNAEIMEALRARKDQGPKGADPRKAARAGTGAA